MSFQIIDNETVIEPVTLPEAKAYMQVDADYASDDATINLALTSARIRLEQWLNVGLVQRDVKVIWDGRPLALPLIPIGDVSGVTKNAETEPMLPADYTVSGYPKSISINSLTCGNFSYWYSITGNVEITQIGNPLSTDYYTVTYQAGYDILPGLLKQALLAEADYIFKLRGLPPTDIISPNAVQLASGYSNNLIL